MASSEVRLACSAEAINPPLTSVARAVGRDQRPASGSQSTTPLSLAIFLLVQNACDEAYLASSKSGTFGTRDSSQNHTSRSKALRSVPN